MEKIKCLKCKFEGALDEFLSALDKDDSTSFILACMHCDNYQKFGGNPNSEDYNKEPQFKIN